MKRRIEKMNAKKIELSWIDVDDFKPPIMRYLLVLQKTDSGKSIPVIARYVPKFTEELSGIDDEDFAEYNENDDTYYIPEGWYEQQLNWDYYSDIYIHDRITHWMLLPEVQK